MVITLWAIVLIYACSLLLLVLSRVVAARSRPFRRFLIGEQADEGWQQRADTAWRREG